MNEKILQGKKNGMAVLLLIILAYIAGIAAIVFSGISLDANGTALGARAGTSRSLAPACWL